jgi:hypothetical protein
MKQKRALKNTGASVRQRLSNLALEQGENFSLILSRYAVERLLHGIGKSSHADEFIQNKQIQWQAFLNKNRLQPGNADFGAVIETIRKFLMPPILRLIDGQKFGKTWPPGGDWQVKTEKR